MRILFALTYYRPHISGVTVYVQRLAEALAARGHSVTVLTSQFHPSLPSEEIIHGVRVRRVPVLFRISKGAIMPRYISFALPLVLSHDVVAINLPSTPSEALIIPLLARMAGKPVTATYHCDVQLPRGFKNRLIDTAVFLDNLLAGNLINRFVAYTDDYANHSRVLSRFPHKRVVIPPPIVVGECTADSIAAFRAQHAQNGERLIGFAARFATEKGVEYMLEALPRIHQQIPDAHILFAGEYQRVVGEQEYADRLQPLLDRHQKHWTFLGVLDPPRMASFYGACDVTVLPSINRTESFGLVQVESMLCGTPVVASAMPGVRVPVRTTGMGRNIPIRNSAALAEAVIDVIQNRSKYVKTRAEIETHFSLQKTVSAYEALFEQLLREKRSRLKKQATQQTQSADQYLPSPAAPQPATPDSAFRRQLRELPAFRALIRSMEYRFFQQVAPLEGPVLDIGCGDGNFANLTFRGPLDAGIDLDFSALREARARKAYRLPMTANATTLPFRTSSFRSVIANCSTEHIPDLDAVLSEIERVLQPGGRFLFSVPTDRFPRFLLGATILRRMGMQKWSEAYSRWLNRRVAHFHMYAPAQWKQRLEQHGFILEKCEPYLSHRATMAFELAHYLGLPRLISRKLTGKWVPFPALSANFFFYPWLAPFLRESLPASGKGACAFYQARKASDA